MGTNRLRLFSLTNSFGFSGSGMLSAGLLEIPAIRKMQAKVYKLVQPEKLL